MWYLYIILIIGNNPATINVTQFETQSLCEQAKIQAAPSTNEIKQTGLNVVLLSKSTCVRRIN